MDGRRNVRGAVVGLAWVAFSCEWSTSLQLGMHSEMDGWMDGCVWLSLCGGLAGVWDGGLCLSGCQ